MSKVTLNNITSGYGSSAALNTNFDLIEAAFDNTLSLDGSTPNQLQTNLDMNGYAILNQRATSGNENFTWEGTWVTGTVYAVNNLVYAPEGSNEGATLICVTAHTAGATLNGDSAKWAVFAQRGASGVGTGDVIGPASATADSLARFSGTTGKLLKDGAVIGIDVMAYDAGLAATTAFAKTLLDDADATTARTTLGAKVDSARAYAEYVTYNGFTGTIPADDTIPQNTEGDEIVTVSITPKSATSRLRVRVNVHSMTANGALSVIGALFRDTTANAVKAGVNKILAAGDLAQFQLEHEEASGSTSATTFKFRMGLASAGTYWVNGSTSARLFGGTSGVTIVVEEV